MADLGHLPLARPAHPELVAAEAMTPTLVLIACLAVGVPVAAIVGAVAATVWYEKVWLPRIAGES